MKNRNFWQSLVCAFRGIASGFRTERNFRIYIGIALVFLALNILTSSGFYDYILLLALSCGVFAVEYINTAVERLCDSFCTEENRDVKFAKDVSASAVLVMGIAFFGTEGAVLVSNLLRIL